MATGKIEMVPWEKIIFSDIKDRVKSGLYDGFSSKSDRDLKFLFDIVESATSAEQRNQTQPGGEKQNERRIQAHR